MKKQNPMRGEHMGHTKGKLNSVFADHEYAQNILDSQGKCSPCRYYRSAILPSGSLRRLCALTGLKLPRGGLETCEFRDVSPWPDGEAVRPQGLPLVGTISGGES